MLFDKGVWGEALKDVSVAEADFYVNITPDVLQYQFEQLRSQTELEIIKAQDG